MVGTAGRKTAQVAWAIAGSKWRKNTKGRAQPDAVRQWLEDGAAVYVCGSLQGMATGVEEALVDIVGAERLEALIAEGRYRRDVY